MTDTPIPELELVARLRMIRGIQLTPTENALFAEAADEIERLTALPPSPDTGLREALECIAGYASSVNDDHMECENCKDAYLDDFLSCRNIARQALATTTTIEEK